MIDYNLRRGFFYIPEYNLNMEHVAEVRIELKKGVVDAEGETVKKSLDLLGFDFEEVKSIKMYSLSLEAENEKEAREKVEEACEKLLANPVIQDYSIEIK